MTLNYTGVNGANQELVDAIAQAWGYVLPGGSIQGTSGARPGGRTSSQHYTGNAWDFGVFRPDGSQVRWDDPEVAMAAEIAASMGLQGFGWGPTYMGGSYFHFDDGLNPYAPRGGVQYWSDDDGGASDTGPGAAQFGNRLQAAAGMSIEDVLALHGLGGAYAGPIGHRASAALGGNELAAMPPPNAAPYMGRGLQFASQAPAMGVNALYAGSTQAAPQPRGNYLDPRAFMGSQINPNALLSYVVNR